ncbi:hypothetical protein ACVIGA_002298 [Bradyrhizobium sp. USDA 3240]
MSDFALALPDSHMDEQAPEHAVLDADRVAYVNAIRAVHADRYLFVDRNDDAVAKLAEQFKDARQTMATEGFGPPQFAPIEVARRSKQDKS